MNKLDDTKMSSLNNGEGIFEGLRSLLKEWSQETKKIVEDGGVIKMFPVIISWTYVFLFNRKLRR